MDAAALSDLADLDFDLGSLDGFRCFDFEFDLPDYLPEFCAGDGDCLLPVVANKKGGLGLDLGSRDGVNEGRESSPDSVVTDDGAPPRSSESSGGCDDGEMSAYVSDLERFLLEDDGEAGGLFAAKDLGPDDHFFNHLVVDYVEPAAEEFSAADHFFGDVDDGYAEPATPGKDLIADNYYFYDEDGCVEPAANASMDDAASAAEDDDAAAGEYDDEASSRKRARYE